MNIINGRERVASILSSVAKYAAIARNNDTIDISDTSSHVVTIGLSIASNRVILLAKRVGCIFETVLSWIMRRHIELVDRSKNRRKLQDTFSWLRSTFGTARVDRIFRHMGINQQTLSKNGELLKKKDFAMVFSYLELVTNDDFVQLFDELRGNADTIRQISGQHLQILKKKFRTIATIEECSSEDIKILESILLPFTSTKQQFFRDQDADIDPSIWSFDRCIQSVAWVRQKMRRSEYTEADWDVVFAKRFSVVRLPDNVTVPHPKGYLYLSHRIEKSASKIFWKPLFGSTVSPIVQYRGTRIPSPAMGFMDPFFSIMEDFRRDLGSRGSIDTYEETKSLLSDPKRGFIKDLRDTVRFIGYSLGGTQAMLDATLLYRHVRGLTTICSPGISLETNELFAKNIRREKVSFPITHVQDYDDAIHLVGQRHLGVDCEPNIVPIVKVLGLSDISKPKSFGCLEDGFTLKNCIRFFAELTRIIHAHCRLVIHGASQERILSSEEARKYLRHENPRDGRFEAIRKRIGSFLWLPVEQFVQFAEACE